MNDKIARFKLKLEPIKYILNGTLVKRHKQCGQLNCRCYGDKDQWHGPYWIWTRKEDGKTITKTLNNEQAAFVKKAIKEMKEVKIVIDKWKVQSLKKIEKL